jgi:D-3-phosphoglycerate dehydrogenase
MDQNRFDKSAADYDAVMVRFATRVDAKLIGGNSRIKAILSPTTGLDHIDLDAAKRRGIRVFHLRDRKALLKTINPTAELTIGLMLSLLRRIPHALDSVIAGRWQAAEFRGHEAAGKTLGIVGYGRLGRKVARAAHALDMKVVAFDSARVDMPTFVRRARSLRHLLRAADVVSLHLPLNDDTRGLLGRRELAAMKPHAVLINTARGALIDEGALLSALRGRRLAGAAVDVLDNEWMIESDGHPMIDFARRDPRLLITPHIGGASFESVEKTDMDVITRYFNWLKTKRIR